MKKHMIFLVLFCTFANAQSVGNAHPVNGPVKKTKKNNGLCKTELCGRPLYGDCGKGCVIHYVSCINHGKSEASNSNDTISVTNPLLNGTANNTYLPSNQPVVNPYYYNNYKSPEQLERERREELKQEKLSEINQRLGRANSDYNDSKAANIRSSQELSNSKTGFNGALTEGPSDSDLDSWLKPKKKKKRRTSNLSANAGKDVLQGVVSGFENFLTEADNKISRTVSTFIANNNKPHESQTRFEVVRQQNSDLLSEIGNQLKSESQSEIRKKVNEVYSDVKSGIKDLVFETENGRKSLDFITGLYEKNKAMLGRIFNSVDYSFENELDSPKSFYGESENDIFRSWNENKEIQRDLK